MAEHSLDFDDIMRDQIRNNINLVLIPNLINRWNKDFREYYPVETGFYGYKFNFQYQNLTFTPFDSMLFNMDGFI